MKALAKRGEREVVVNLSGVKFISSPGLGILVHARSDFLVTGGMLRLCELRDRNISILLYTKTMLLFEELGVRRLVVVDQTGAFAGIATQSDMLRAHAWDLDVAQQTIRSLATASGYSCRTYT